MSETPQVGGKYTDQNPERDGRIIRVVRVAKDGQVTYEVLTNPRWVDEALGRGEDVTDTRGNTRHISRTGLEKGYIRIPEEWYE